MSRETEVGPDYFLAQNDAQKELIEDLIKKRAAYNEAMASGNQEQADKHYAEYEKFRDEIRINHPEFRHSSFEEMIIGEADKLNKDLQAKHFKKAA